MLVPQDWVELFPPGRNLGLDTFGLGPKDIGKPSDLTGRRSCPPTRGSGRSSPTRSPTTQYLVLKSSALELDHFATAVFVGALPEGKELMTKDINGTPSPVDATEELESAYWPRSCRRSATGSLCAVLDAVPGPGARACTSPGPTPAARRAPTAR